MKSINNCRNKKNNNKRAAISAAALGRALVCAAAFSANPQPRLLGTTTALKYRNSGGYDWPTTSLLKPHDPLSAESKVVPKRGGKKASRWMMPATLAVPPECASSVGSQQLDEYIAYCEKRYRDRVLNGSRKPSVSFSSQTPPATINDLGSGMLARAVVARTPSAVEEPSSFLNRLQHSLVCLFKCGGSSLRGVTSLRIFSRALGALLVRSGYGQSTTAIASLATIVALLVLRPLTRQV